ncbi:MFS transporter [Isosphaeraceae bacterium EP7]
MGPRVTIVVFLMAFSFLNHSNRTSMAIAGDGWLLDQFHLSPTELGAIYSAFLFAYTAAMTPGGWLVDRIGPRLSVGLVGLITGVLAIGTGAAGGLASTAGMLLLSLTLIRGAMGMASAPLYPGAGAAVVSWVAPGRRVTAMSLIVCAAPIGIACTFLVFGPLLRWLGGPGAFAVQGLVTASVAIGWLIYVSDRPKEVRTVLEPSSREPVGGMVPVWALLRNRSLVLLTLCYATVSYFEYLFFYWMHYYFQTVLKLPAELSDTYSTYLPMSLAVGIPLGGWLSDRLSETLGARRARALVGAGGMIASAGLLWLGLLASSPGWIVTWFSLAMGVIGLTEGPIWMSSVEIGGKRGGLSGAICNTGGNAGGTLAPFLTAVVGERFGWPAAISLGSLFCLVGVASWIWIDPEERIA